MMISARRAEIEIQVTSAPSICVHAPSISVAVVSMTPPKEPRTAPSDSTVEFPDNVLLVSDSVPNSPWSNYRIRLKKLDLSSIKTGFLVTLSGRGSPVTIYLDSIRFVRK